MANQKIEIRKFGQYNADKLLYELDRAGEAYTVDSEYLGMGYALKKDSLIIVAGKNGAISVAMEEVPNLLEEIKAVYELLIARENAGITHGYFHVEPEN